MFALRKRFILNIFLSSLIRDELWRNGTLLPGRFRATSLLLLMTHSLVTSPVHERSRALPAHTHTHRGGLESDTMLETSGKNPSSPPYSQSSVTSCCQKALRGDRTRLSSSHEERTPGSHLSHASSVSGHRLSITRTRTDTHAHSAPGTDQLLP